jgi:hypothetical protein
VQTLLGCEGGLRGKRKARVEWAIEVVGWCEYWAAARDEKRPSRLLLRRRVKGAHGRFSFIKTFSNLKTYLNPNQI